MGNQVFWFPPNDEIGLANTIVKGFADPSKLSTMGLYGKAICEKNYSWDKIATLTLQAYLSL